MSSRKTDEARKVAIYLTGRTLLGSSFDFRHKIFDEIGDDDRRRIGKAREKLANELIRRSGLNEEILRRLLVESKIDAEHQRNLVSFERGEPGSNTHRWRGTTWTLKVAAKASKCAWSGKPIHKTDLVYMPDRSSYIRDLRVLASEWDG